MKTNRCIPLACRLLAVVLCLAAGSGTPAQQMPQDTGTGTALFYAAQSNDMKRAEALLASGANVNARAGKAPFNPYAALTPLHVAAEYNSKEVAALLLRRGASVNVKDLGGQTPLHFAAKLRNTSIAALLLKYHADVNAMDTDGDTPLMKAINSGKDMVELLVNNGANVNQKNNYGDTPLMYATRIASSYGNNEIITFLLEHGADPNAHDERGQTALATAIHKNDDAHAALLRSHGAKSSDLPSYADLEVAADAGNTAKLQELLAKLPAANRRKLVNWRNMYGAGLLWGAAAQNRSEVVKILLENGADPKTATNDGKTPLHEAATHMATTSAAEQETAVEIAIMLLNKGADVNAKTSGGTTPLEFARVNHQERMVDMLRQHGGHE